LDSEPIKVLVVDDTLFYRKILCDVINEIPGVKTIGTASNGRIALSRVSSLKPSLVVMDIHMPEMDGIETLENIKKDWPDIGVIMISAHNQKDSKITMKALEMGAFDFIPKPESENMEQNLNEIKKALVPMIKAFLRRKEIRSILKRQKIPEIKKPQPPVKTNESSDFIKKRMEKIAANTRLKSQVVAIGISTGGPNALAVVIPKLPADLNVPVLIVQHMPPVFTNALAQSLNNKSSLKVVEATHREEIQSNTVYIAPGGKQMKVDCSNNSKIIKITDDPPENNCKPSADYLFRSVAECYGERTTAVIMTGMGSDGSAGLKLLKAKGAKIIAQNEKTCVVYGMPREPIEAGIVNVISPLDDIACEIIKTV